MNNSSSSDSDRFLAVGSVTRSDRLVVELVQPPDTPAAILTGAANHSRPSLIQRSSRRLLPRSYVLGMAQLSGRAPRGWALALEHCEAPTVYFGDFAFALDQRYAVLDAACHRRSRRPSVSYTSAPGTACWLQRGPAVPSRGPAR